MIDFFKVKFIVGFDGEIKCFYLFIIFMCVLYLFFIDFVRFFYFFRDRFIIFNFFLFSVYIYFLCK